VGCGDPLSGNSYLFFLSPKGGEVEKKKDQKQESKSSLNTIDEAIKSFFEDLKNKEKKLSVSDAIRLLELRKQLASEQIREVKVTWVESSKSPFANSK
jgi:hypothetical protein